MSTVTIEVNNVRICVFVQRNQHAINVSVCASDTQSAAAGQVVLTLNTTPLPANESGAAPPAGCDRRETQELPDCLRESIRALKESRGIAPEQRLLQSLRLGAADASAHRDGRTGVFAVPRTESWVGNTGKVFAILRSSLGRPAWTASAHRREELLTDNAGRPIRAPLYRSFESRAELRAYFWGADVPFPRDENADANDDAAAEEHV